MHIDHPSRTASEEQPGRTIKGESPLAGVFTEAGHYETNGWDGPGIYAKARIMPQFIEDIKAMDGHIGISHYVSGMSEMGEADGKKGPIIKELIAHPTNTVDFVTVPGAGGRYRAMFSEIATRNTEIKKKGANMPEKLTLKEIKANHSGLILELKEELIKEIQNADDGKAVLKEIADAKTEIKTIKEENADLKKKLAEGAAKEFISEKLSEAKLPDASKKILEESLLMQVTHNEDGTIDAIEFEKTVSKAIEAKTAEIEAILKETGGKITGNGGTSTGKNTEDGHKALVESFTASYVAMGRSLEDAGKLAELAAGGR